MQFGRWVTMFWRNIYPPIFRIEHSYIKVMALSFSKISLPVYLTKSHIIISQNIIPNFNCHMNLIPHKTVIIEQCL